MIESQTPVPRKLSLRAQVRAKQNILYMLMAASLAIQTVSACFYKIQTLTPGKDMRVWKHPYLSTALTAIGKMGVFIVYYMRQA